MIDIDNRRCDGCATCVSVCPANALVLDPELAVDAALCITCGRCVAVCPFGALSPAGSAKEPNHGR